MPTTSRGYRYPGTGEAPNGPAAVQALAEDVNNDITAFAPRRGRVTGSVPAVGAGGVVDRPVTFSPPFPSGVLPCVALGIGEASVAILKATYTALTNTGMTIRIHSSDIAVPNAAVTYIAIAP